MQAVSEVLGSSVNRRTYLSAFSSILILSGAGCATHTPPPTLAEQQDSPRQWEEIGKNLTPATASAQAPAEPQARPEPAAEPAAVTAAAADELPAEEVKAAEADPLESFLEEGLEAVDEVPDETSDLEGAPVAELGEPDSEVLDKGSIELPADGFFSKHDPELSEKLGGLTVFRGYPRDGSTPKNFVPIVYNKAVEKWISYFTSPKGSVYMERWLAREKRYGPVLRTILKERGLPEEIVYLAMIESGFNVRAYSTARAVGLWQFIAGTGKRYDLAINWWVDERRDPVRATQAAASYLDDLYTEFDSWYLAFAAYNTGEGKIRKVKRRTGADSFWEMRTIRSKRQGLFPETREYVPKYMAAAIIAQAPEKFGFKHLPVAEDLDFDTVTVPGGTSLYLAATAAECDYEDMKRLNPHLLRWFVPPNVAQYEIRVPAGKGPGFIARFDELSQTEGLDDFKRYEWEKGDNLLSVAYRHTTDPDAVALINGGRRDFRAGETVKLPVPKSVEPLPLPKNWKHASRLMKRHDAVEPHWAAETGHVVVGRESLKSIARQYGVTTNALRLWNRLDKRGRVRVGDVLTIYKASGDARDIALASTTTPEFISYPSNDNEPVNPIKGLTGEEIGVYGGRGRPDRETSAPKAGGKAAASDSSNRTHMVRRGENASVIARRYDLSMADLRKLNPGKNLDRLHVGDRLVLRPSAPAAAKSAGKADTKTASKKNAAPRTASRETSSSSADAERRHKVKSGENATKIARRYGVSLPELREWNPGINLNRLKAGQTLMIRERSGKS